MPTLSDAPAPQPKAAWLEAAHAIATPLLNGLTALRDLGQRCHELELAAAHRDDTLAEATELVAIARKVSDLCTVGARGCTIGSDPDIVADAMRTKIDAITRADRLATTTDGHEAWSLVPG